MPPIATTAQGTLKDTALSDSSCVKPQASRTTEAAFFHKNGAMPALSPSPSFSQFLSPRSTLSVQSGGSESPRFQPDASYFFFSTSLGPSCSSFSADGSGLREGETRDMSSGLSQQQRQSSESYSDTVTALKHAVWHQSDLLHPSLDFEALEWMLHPRFDRTLVPYLAEAGLKTVETMDTIAATMPAFNMEARVSFYSDRTGLVQSLAATSLFEFLQENKASAKPASQIWSQLKNTNEYFWMDVYRPNADDLGLLSLLFNLHPLTVEDISVHDAFEKCESFDHYLFYCLRPCDPLVSFTLLSKEAFFPDNLPPSPASSATQGKERVFEGGAVSSQQHSTSQASATGASLSSSAMSSSCDSFEATTRVSPVQQYMVDPNSPWYEKNHIYVLHFPSGIVTLHATPAASLGSTLAKLHLSRHRSKTRTGIGAELVPCWTPDYFLFLLLESLLDEAKSLLTHLQLECDIINNDLMMYLKAEDRPVILSRIARTRKRLLYLQRRLRPKLDILNQFISRYHESMKEQASQPATEIAAEESIIRPWTFSNLENLKEVTSYTLKQANSLYEALQHSMTSYCDQVNISMTASSVETDRLMKRLTVMACVLLPPSLIIDFYGMNIPLPGSRRYAAAGGGGGQFGPLFIHATVILLILLASYMIIRRLNGRPVA